MFPKGQPASAAQYRCLNAICIPLRAFLRGLSDAKVRALAAGLPDPSSFPGGEDSYHQFIRVDGPAGSGDLLPTEGGRPFGVPCSLSAERVDFLESAGDLDPVVVLRNSYPELTSIITSPQSWMKDPLPSAKDIPRGCFMVDDYDVLVEKEVRTGFCNLFTEEQCWRLPDGSVTENGTFGV